MVLVREFHLYLIPRGISRMAPQEWGKQSFIRAPKKIPNLLFFCALGRSRRGFCSWNSFFQQIFPKGIPEEFDWYSHNSHPKSFGSLWINPQLKKIILAFLISINWIKRDFDESWALLSSRGGNLSEVPSATGKHSQKISTCSSWGEKQGILGAPFPSRPFP